MCLPATYHTPTHTIGEGTGVPAVNLLSPDAPLMYMLTPSLRARDETVIVSKNWILDALTSYCFLLEPWAK